MLHILRDSLHRMQYKTKAFVCSQHYLMKLCIKVGRDQSNVNARKVVSVCEP